MLKPDCQDRFACSLKETIVAPRDDSTGRDRLDLTRVGLYVTQMGGK